jgi:hypothetical protein
MFSNHRYAYKWYAAVLRENNSITLESSSGTSQAKQLVRD